MYLASWGINCQVTAWKFSFTIFGFPTQDTYTSNMPSCNPLQQDSQTGIEFLSQFTNGDRKFFSETLNDSRCWKFWQPCTLQQALLQLAIKQSRRWRGGAAPPTAPSFVFSAFQWVWRSTLASAPPPPRIRMTKLFSTKFNADFWSRWTRE